MRGIILAAVIGGWHPLPTPVTVADNYWPASPCHGHATVLYVDQAKIDAVIPADPPGRHGGVAFVEECTAWILKGMDPVSTCGMIVHELGHLAGLGHSVGGVMDPVHLHPPDACYQLPGKSHGRVVPRGRTVIHRMTVTAHA